MVDLVVYRSTHPDVLAHWEATASAEAQRAWHVRVGEALVDLGFDTAREFVVTDGWNAIEVTGVVHPDGQPIPDGWRTDKRSSAVPSSIVPALRTSRGKKASARLAELNAPNPRKNLPGGMPGHAHAALAFLRPRVERLGGAVYVCWTTEPHAHDLAKINPAVWERIRLSEYYAAREREDEAGGRG